MDLIKIAEQAFATKNEFPDFIPGDTVTVAYRIKEGNKERIQQYRGVVIKINGEGEKPTDFEIMQLDANHLKLIYAAPGTAGWGEATWWAFKAKK